MPRVANRFVRDDGKQVICIVEQEDGRFSLVEERGDWTERCERGPAGDRFWTMAESSSSHDTLEAAQRELAAQFGWILDA